MPTAHPLLIAALAAALPLTQIAPLPAQAQQEASQKVDKPREAKKTNKKKQRKKKKSVPLAPAAQPKPVTPEDYGKWESLGRGGDKLSADGRWLAYTVTRVDKERSLHLLDLQSDKPSEAVLSVKQGERPVFSDDSQWLAITIGKSPAEIKQAQKAAAASGGRPAPPKPSGQTMKLRHLADGKMTELKNVTAFHFSADSRFAVIEVSAAATGAKPAPASKALVVRNLATGSDNTFGNVTRHGWSDDGSLLAMVVDSPTISNSLQVFDPGNGTLRTLDSSDQDYTKLSWRKDSTDLVVMREMEHGDKEDVSHVLLAWRDLSKQKKRAKSKGKGKGKSRGKAMSFEHAEAKGFPEKMYIAADSLSWSKSGAAIFVDLKEWENKPKSLAKPEPGSAGKGKADADKQAASKGSPEKKAAPATAKKKRKAAEKKAPAPASPPKKEEESKSLRETLEAEPNVEIWHAKDVDIMPRQKKQAAVLKNPARRAVWWPESGEFIQLGNELTERIEPLRRDGLAVGLDHTPHERTGMFGPKLSDVYLIDTKSGKRERVLEGIQYLLSSSPDGEYLLYIQEGNVWSYEVDGGRRRNLTGRLETHFTDQQDDSLAKEKRPYSRGQWLADSSGVLLYDRFNIWLLNPDGSSARRLTDGDGEMVRHRLSRANLTEKDDGLIDPTRPFYIGLYGDRNKKTGYARMRLDAEATAKPEVLIWEDRSVHSLARAEDNGDVWLFKREANDDSPDLFLAGAGLADAQQLTETNPFQKDFLWGRSELVDYTNANGVELQGALIYPAGYEKGKTYPMVVYIYERLSQNLHRYVSPSETQPYNPTVFSAEGYFVFMPDIVYRGQEPGISAVECLVPAVETVIETGMVDRDRIALVGHSWGGYQTAFTVTQTDLFAAGVAGAPLTDMMSMSVQVYWNTGNTNARIFHVSQGRMSTPFWRDVDNYVRNSPIHGMDSLNTPLLVTFGDKDGAVDFGQGVEMYNAARLAQKEDFVMLVYPGENHGLRKEENSVDYHYRILEWLAHYLDGEDAPKWITEGKSYIEREKEKEDKKKAKELEKQKKAPSKPAPKS